MAIGAKLGSLARKLLVAKLEPNDPELEFRDSSCQLRLAAGCPLVVMTPAHVTALVGWGQE